MPILTEFPVFYYVKMWHFMFNKAVFLLRKTKNLTFISEASSNEINSNYSLDIRVLQGYLRRIFLNGDLEEHRKKLFVLL